MKYLITFLLGFSGIFATAQTHTQAFIACGKSFTSVCERMPDRSIKVIIIDGGTTTNRIEYTITTDDFEIFSQRFQQGFQALPTAPNPACAAADADKILSFGRQLYFNFTASQTDDLPGPVAGLFRVKEECKVFTTYKGGVSENNFKVVKVKVEIADGYIENIKASILINGKIFHFMNYYGIGFSSVTNFSKLRNIRLYELHSSAYPGRNTISYYLLLNNLIDYDYDLALGRRDYSPQDMEFNLNGGESIVLHKQMTKKLFEAHIYTDFVGLNEGKPNGLVQTEVSKRINLNTVQFQTHPRQLYHFFKSYGFFQYVTPGITLSKLEQHNKKLLLGDLDSIRLNPGKSDTSKFERSRHRYATALDLYQYQQFSVGSCANILFLSNHDLKYNFYFNFGVRLGITQITDSLSTIAGGVIGKTGQVNEYSVNTLQFYPEAVLTVLPEERISFSLSEKLLYLKSYYPGLQVISYDRKDNTRTMGRNSTCLSISEMLLTVQVNENSKLFGRARFIADIKNFQTNFAQIQLGYSVYILGNSQKKPQ